jgi:hypothetical protein
MKTHRTTYIGGERPAAADLLLWARMMKTHRTTHLGGERHTECACYFSRQETIDGFVSSRAEQSNIPRAAPQEAARKAAGAGLVSIRPTERRSSNKRALDTN